MKKLSVTINLILSLFTFAIALADDGTSLHVYVESDRKMFDDREHVVVDVKIENRGTTAKSFFLYDFDYTTLQPVIYDARGREASTKVAYRQSGYTADMMVTGAEPRTIELKPGETFVKTLNLADYYELEYSRDYRVRVLFLPDAATKEAMSSANIYSFHIDETAYPSLVEEESNKLRGEASLRPAEIVQLFLSAEKNGRWNDYLKYIDLDQYIYSYPDFARSYLSSNKTIRQKVVDDFEEYLIEPRPDNVLDFSVTKETVKGTRATVEAVVSRAASGRPFIYNYTYTLERDGALWKVTGVDAAVSRKRFN